MTAPTTSAPSFGSSFNFGPATASAATGFNLGATSTTATGFGLGSAVTTSSGGGATGGLPGAPGPGFSFGLSKPGSTGAGNILLPSQ